VAEQCDRMILAHSMTEQVKAPSHRKREKGLMSASPFPSFPAGTRVSTLRAQVVGQELAPRRRRGCRGF
jgi:hypothetical protein